MSSTACYKRFAICTALYRILQNSYGKIAGYEYLLYIDIDILHEYYRTILSIKSLAFDQRI
jgi:hypothetical protein